MRYEKLSDLELKSDSSFRKVLDHLHLNSTLLSASLIGATQNRVGLATLFHIYFRLASGFIVRAEASSELSIVKILKMVNEDFSSNLVSVNQEDPSIMKIMDCVKSKIPSLSESNYLIT